MTRSILIAAYSSLFALGLADNVRGPVFAEILKTYQISDSIGSWLFAISSMGGVLGAASSRAWLARWSRIETLNIALFGNGLGVLLMAVAPSFEILLVASFILGLSMGLMGVLQNTLAASAVLDANRSRILSGLHAMYGFASFLAPLIVAGTAALVISWRWAFVGAAIFSWGTVLWNHVRFRQFEHAGRSHSSLLHAPMVTRKAATIWFAILIGAYVLAEVMVSSRLALYFRREQGADLSMSSLAVTVFFAALLVGRLLTAWFPVRWPLRWTLMGLLLFSGVLIWAGLGLGWPWLVPLSGFPMAPFYPLAVAHLKDEFGDEMDGAMSWVTGTQSLTLFSMHLGIGWLTDLWGIGSAIAIGSIALLVSFLMVGAYGPIFHRHAPRI